MVNERYEEEGHEEGEYHFSDDQANYDMESDPSVKNTEAAAVLSKVSMGDKLKQHRRIVIAIVVFIVLLGIVYKLVTPSATPVTDIQPGAPAAPPKKMETLPAQPKPVMPTAAMQPAVMQKPIQSPPPSVQTAPPVQPAQPVQPAMPMPGMPQQAVTAEQPPVAEPPQAAAAPMEAPVSPNVMQTNKNINDRLAIVEQQNSAMMNLMQTQYAQKIADTELQNTQLRTQVQELTARISNMEVAFRQLTKMLRSANAGPPPAARENAPARMIQPAIKYVVQAIIPGRAWLKSDSGETVTVAEGDLLKGYGRITKIDPYDGVVNIDTGTRVISLAYGLSGD